MLMILNDVLLQTDLQPSPARIRRFRQALLDWFDEHARDLPWRAKSGAMANPYHVLVSEFMLQQTQVATVISYFQRFITAFPTIESLAQADQQQVLRLWQGLGYYSRARNLHAAAKQVVEQDHGQLPSTIDQLLKLPGVGRYTAGAVASIAFDTRAAALDGNVMRVLGRWLGVTEPVNQADVKAMLWQVAQTLVPVKNPGDYNQALMELGALVCSPKRPECKRCPLVRTCAAKKMDLVNELPRKLPRAAPQRVTHVIVALYQEEEQGRRYLFQQRDQRGLWARLWQLPTIENFTTAPNSKQIKAAIEPRFKVKWSKLQKLGTFPHQTTHRTITFELWQGPLMVGQVSPSFVLDARATVWRALNNIDDLPLANPQRKAVETLKNA